MNLLNKGYLNKIVIYDIFFIKRIFICIYFYFYFFYKYMNLNKYKISVISRIYRNLRVVLIKDFFFFNYKIFNKKTSFIFGFKNFLNLFFSFSLMNSLIFHFRFLKKFKICVYLQKLKFYLYLTWIDFYAVLKAIDELILYRESFFFKYDIPLMLYSLYLFININYIKNNLNFLYFSFYGFKFFFRKKKFKYKFYVRLI
jgi:hypothetical protein